MIVRHYAPKIKILALRLKGKLPQQVELNELLSAGTLGLIECLGKFKPELNIKFETYAENRIRGAMLDELRRMDWFSRGLRQRVRMLEEAIRKIENRTGHRASKDELSQETGLSEREVEAALGALQNQLCLSLDAIQDHFSPDQSAHIDNEPYKTTALQDIIDKIASLIDELTMREKLVLSLYYSEELNMRETAEVMGITEGRVSQLHSQALKKLKTKFRAAYGRE
ncbi:RNA polymerase sigma factor for flagellar operon FliA [Desulfobaculum xiamenense]|uniref:RNA polymerase sigma factor for flagellar operon FliA n=1 Tax=Desulfobaculum xiamenense TaxID=995050 RepID=A0A846QIZ9_9BACT|nr:RNA polymerase sigma factor for flagellar operon FliA [Desulfobaculum xiamenense]